MRKQGAIVWCMALCLLMGLAGCAGDVYVSWPGAGGTGAGGTGAGGAGDGGTGNGGTGDGGAGNGGAGGGEAEDEGAGDIGSIRLSQEDQAWIQGLTAAILDPDGDGVIETGSKPLNRAARPNGADLTLTLEPDGVLSYGVDELGKDDPHVFDEFGAATAALTIVPWQGTTQSRTSGNVKDELVVYHNAEKPKSIPYMEYFSRLDANYELVNRRPAVVASFVDGSLDADGNPQGAANQIYDPEVTNEGRLRFNSGSVSRRDAALFGGETFTFEPGAVRTVTVVNAAEEDGTFAGVPGFFSCTYPSTCSATSDTEGNLASLGTNWVFQPTPEEAAGQLRDVHLDADYLSFGYWLQTTTLADGTTAYGVNPFHAGALAYDTSVVSPYRRVTGTATYTGKATGMYVVKTFVAGLGVPSEAGQFTADARIVAHFGGNEVPLADQFTISDTSTIANFRNADGGMIADGAWTVNLWQSARFGTASNDTDNSVITVNSFTGNTTGGGSYSGNFYGRITVREADGTITPVQPTGVAGVFNAHLTNGHVVGAFGATR